MINASSFLAKMNNLEQSVTWIKEKHNTRKITQAPSIENKENLQMDSREVKTPRGRAARPRPTSSRHRQLTLYAIGTLANQSN
jgi:hypothetical protein